MKIVRAKVSDIPGIIKLNSSNAKCMELSSWVTDENILRYNYVNNDWAIYYVIKHNNQIIAGLALDLSESYIEILVVDKKWQKKGIGTLLIEHAIKRLREEFAPYIKVGSYDKFKAIPFYEKLGFNKSDRQFDGFEYWTELTKDLT